jgi:hypothetical protein
MVCVVGVGYWQIDDLLAEMDEASVEENASVLAGDIFAVLDAGDQFS